MCPWPTPTPAPSTAYLHAGLEPPALRRRYTDDLQRAGERLAALSDQGLGPDARSAIRAIDSALPVYAGYVESARANSRHEFPLGAAYLRRASDLMRSTILPAATDLYRQAAMRLDRSYRRRFHAIARAVPPARGDGCCRSTRCRAGVGVVADSTEPQLRPVRRDRHRRRARLGHVLDLRLARAGVDALAARGARIP